MCPGMLMMQQVLIVGSVTLRWLVQRGVVSDTQETCVVRSLLLLDCLHQSFSLLRTQVLLHALDYLLTLLQYLLYLLIMLAWWDKGALGTAVVED